MKEYPATGSSTAWLARLCGAAPPAKPFRAVDGIGFSLRAGESVGLVGESGCGKSTTSAMVARRRPRGLSPSRLAYYANPAKLRRPITRAKDDAMPTRNVVLTAHHERLIAALVNTGRYQNASEVLREGLRMVEAREARDAAKLEALRQMADTGFADLDQGRHRDLHDDELEDFIASLGRLAGQRVSAAGS